MLSTLQRRPRLGLGRSLSHVIFRLRLSTALESLAQRPLLASGLSLFFFFFIFCFLCLCKTHTAKRKEGGERRRREPGECDRYSIFFFSDREMTSFPAQAIPGRGAGDYVTTLTPQRNRDNCHCLSNCTPSQHFALCHFALPSIPSGGDILHYISFIPGSQRGGGNRNRVQTRFVQLSCLGFFPYG